MAGLGQILHMGKEHVYTKHLQRMRDDMLVLEPSQQEGRAPHGKDKRPLTSAPRETNTQEVKLIFPKTEARGSLESPDASFSQVSLESLPQRAFPVSPHCCWDPSRLPLQLLMGHRYRGTGPVLSTQLGICWTPACVVSVAQNTRKSVPDVKCTGIETRGRTAGITGQAQDT